MPWALILPMIFDVIMKCIEERNKDQDEIVEAMMNPGDEEKRICRYAVRKAMAEGGYLRGKSWKKRRKILSNGRKRAWERLESTTRVEAEVMVAGVVARMGDKA